MKRLARIGVAVFLALVALGIAGCGVSGHAPNEPEGPEITLEPGSQAACRPDFPAQGGWFGGDAAASVVLPGERGQRSLWLFGDSFVARPGEPAERRYPFVHNAIAISRCKDDGVWTLEFGWKPQAAFFEPESDSGLEANPHARDRRDAGEATYYWPLSGAVVRGTLFVALLRVAPATPQGPFGLPFRPVGVDLARIENPEQSPDAWKIRYSTLSSRGDVLPASALVPTHDALHAFAFLDRGDGRFPRILMRIAVRDLAVWKPELESALETLAQDGRWIPGNVPERARILMADDASEMSVHFDPGLREWLAVYSDPTGDPTSEPMRESTSPSGPAPSDLIWLRRAKQLAGPWSERVALGRIPELARPDGPSPGEPFCYAARAHPELAPSGALLVTYVCNLFAARADETSAVLERLRTTPSLYRPRPVLFPVPTAAPPPRAAPQT